MAKRPRAASARAAWASHAAISRPASCGASPTTISGSMASIMSDLDQLCINTIRTLSVDAVQQANSGHPGTPMALAPVAYLLWQRHLRFDPQDPIWPDRDRFVLSVGHASMLLYSLLHLTGVKAVNPKYETLGQLSVEIGRAH